MGVNSLPKTVTRQRRDCDLNPGPSVPESSMLTTRLWRSCTCRHILQFRGVTLLCYDFCCTCNSNFCCGIYLNASVLAAFSQRKMHHVMSVDIQFTTHSPELVQHFCMFSSQTSYTHRSVALKNISHRSEVFQY